MEKFNRADIMQVVLVKLDKIDSKIDKLDGRVSSVDLTLAKQEVSLAEHIRRTNLLEGELMPVKRHVGHLEGAMKFVGVISIITGIAVAIVRMVVKQ